MSRSRLRCYSDLYRPSPDSNTKRRSPGRTRNYDRIQLHVNRLLMVALLIVNTFYRPGRAQNTNDTASYNGTTPTSRTNYSDQTSQQQRLDDQQKDINVEHPEQRDVDEAVLFGLEKMHDLYFVREPMLYEKGFFLEKSHPGYALAAFRTASNDKSAEYARYGYAAVQASSKIAQTLSDIKTRQSAPGLSFLRSSLLSEQCPLRGLPHCPPSFQRYRTADGTCNNPKDPWRGASMLPMQRFLPPHYDDGIQSIRLSVSGKELPSAREVSVRIHRDRDRETSALTAMFMQWGQFLDHDIIFSAQARMFNRSVPRCCKKDGRGVLPFEFTHPECLPIEVAERDWFFGPFGIRCMEFVRSAPTSRINCNLGWREQISQVTAYIDGSNVYGNDLDTSEGVRLFKKGHIAYGRSKTKGPLQPPDPPGGELCRLGAITSDCFQSGDFRINDQPGLTALHTVWVRYHNNIAQRLSALNPHWSDEKIFQEVRRIIGATIQHITYKEFLPILLGQEVTKVFDINVLSKGYYDGYNSKINPAPASSFGTAAFRFGHSLVPSSLMRTDTFHRFIPNNVTLHEEQENIENIWSLGSLDRLLLGLSNQAPQKRDEFISRELTNHLFQSSGFPFGMDLAAINVQRGRDHGVPSYTSWREPCGLTSLSNWTDFEKVMSEKTAKRLELLYNHIDDVDLFSGGLAEKPVRGGVVGPTFACIIAQQFSNLRKGDRFWYENGNFESSFTPAQLRQIRKITLGHVLCRSLTEVETLQPFVFLIADKEKNPRLPCDIMKKDFNLKPWIESLDEGRNLNLNVSNETKSVEDELSLESRIDNDADDLLESKARRRTTKAPRKGTKSTKRPQTNQRPQKPFKVKLTNISSAPVKNNKNKFSSNQNNKNKVTYNRPANQNGGHVAQRPSQHVNVLENSNVDGYLVNYPSSDQTKYPSEEAPFSININIQVIPNGQPTKNNIKKQPTPFNYDFDRHTHTITLQKPNSQPILIINKHKDQPYSHFVTQQTPYIYTQEPFDNYHSKYDMSYSPTFYRTSTQRTVFEKQPFSTSENRPTDSDKNDDYRKPSIIIPSYLFLDETKTETINKPTPADILERPDFDDLTQSDRDQIDHHNPPPFDENDYETDLTRYEFDEFHPHYLNQNSKETTNLTEKTASDKFVKISSVKGEKFVLNKDLNIPVYFAIHQREGELELKDEELKPDVETPTTTAEVEGIPSELEFVHWTIYNETEDTDSYDETIFSQLNIFELINKNNSSDNCCSTELPHPIKNDEIEQYT